MAGPREIQAKSVLGKSGITDYCVNCYVGCLHNCVYCYARFMRRFTNHAEPWGRFVDAKVNAPDTLAREVRRKPPGTVFVSSVCDPYQPAERRFGLTRQCLKLLIDSGFHPSILTKSTLVTRDFDILRSHDNCDLGFTLTTVDERLRFRIEPGASPTWERIAALRRACDLGIRSWAFLGPFMPGLSDTDEALDALVSAVAPLPLCHIYADKLNPRASLWRSVADFLARFYPELVDRYRRLFFDPEEYQAYRDDLAARMRAVARRHGVADRLRGLC